MVFTVVKYIAFILLGHTFAQGRISSTPVCQTKECKKTANRILQYMDPTVNPCDDFYRFACGNFLKNTTPHEIQGMDVSFTQVQDKIQVQLMRILSKIPRSIAVLREPRPYRLVKHMFALCMDERKINARGVGHAVRLLEAAGGWPVLGNWDASNWNFLDTEIRLRRLAIGGSSLFTIGVTTNMKNSSRQMIQVNKPKLGLSMEYLCYGEDNPAVKAYYSFMVDIAVMYGADRQTAQEHLKRSLLFEIELAKIIKPKEERRNYNDMYNPFTLQDLTRKKGWINWVKLLENLLPKGVSLMADELINISDVDFLTNLGNLVRNHSNEVIANYMMWRAASGLTSLLTQNMRARYQEFSNEINGKSAQPPRWTECVEVAKLMPLALASLYVKKFFDESSKKEAEYMTAHIRRVMIQDLRQLDWMDEQTKKNAEYKALRMVDHIGYPIELKNIRKLEYHYRKLRLNKKHYFEATLDLMKWTSDTRFYSLQEPINKTDWRSHGSVYISNSYYIPLENSMWFPAGVLQLPFFSLKRPKYVNYGTIGNLIGHEMTHGFDDQGSQFDYKGDLHDWWKGESKQRFNKRKQCIIDQYSNFIDNQTGLHVNGINTQGENIADNGGLKLSYRAYRTLANQLSEPEPGLPGLQQYSNDQLFLLSMANMWCLKIGPTLLRLQILTEVHSPHEFRVKGMVQNFPEFGEIFQCKLNEPMNPRNKCRLW